MIALAGDVFDRLSMENQEVVTLEKKVFFLADYVFDKNLANRGNVKQKYTYVLIPQLEEGVEKWEGKMKMFRSFVENATS